VTVRILPSSDAEAALWRTTLEVAQLFCGWPWVIIGAQSVMLLAHERGRPAGRTTGDIDVLLDIRVVVGGARAAAGRLMEAGFEPSAEHPHRFVRGTEQVDLLAPDHLGPNADLTTVPPQTTSEIPGGTRALATRHDLEIDVVGVGTGTVPVPSLAGARVIKVRAWHARRRTRPRGHRSSPRSGDGRCRRARRAQGRRVPQIGQDYRAAGRKEFGLACRP
jgi:predicted nucleotidyltransferase